MTHHRISTYRFLILQVLLLLPWLANAQSGECMLSGYVYITDGPVCKYVVYLNISGDRVTGRSATMQPEGLELDANIMGRLDRKRHTLTFRESKMPLVYEPDNCMFNVQLSYRVSKGNYIFDGAFTGFNDQGDTCDGGTMLMELKKEAAAPFSTDNRPRPISQKTIFQPVSTPPKPVEFGKITAAVKKEFTWTSDTCVLDIWDGEIADGDIVTVYLNGRAVLPSYTLLAEKKRLVLVLPAKVNTIAVHAENEGKAPPNTSLIMLSDGAAQYGVQACIHTGETTQIIIRKR